MRTQMMRAVGMAVVLALMAVSAQAGDALFSPLEIKAAHGNALSLDTSFQAILNDPSRASLRLVRANPEALTERAATLTLDLDYGLEVSAHRVESYRATVRLPVWSGVIEDAGLGDLPFRPRRFTSTRSTRSCWSKNGDTITGNVHFQAASGTRSGRSTARRPRHRAGRPAQCPRTTRRSCQSCRAMTCRSGRRPTPRSAADTVIRVMVHYTSSAASASGNINGLIDLAVAETNQGYTNSGVLIDLVLATKSQVTYTQSGNFSTDLSRYRGTSDGYMDSIHTTRNSVAADVALLVINNASSCGLASGIGSTASTAFADALLGLRHRLLLVRARDRAPAVRPPRPRHRPDELAVRLRPRLPLHRQPEVAHDHGLQLHGRRLPAAQLLVEPDQALQRRAHGHRRARATTPAC